MVTDTENDPLIDVSFRQRIDWQMDLNAVRAGMLDPIGVKSEWAVPTHRPFTRYEPRSTWRYRK